MNAGMGGATANASSFDQHAKRGKRKWVHDKSRQNSRKKFKKILQIS